MVRDSYTANDDSLDSHEWSARKKLEVGLRVAEKGILPAVELTADQARELLKLLDGPNEREKKLLQALSLCHLHCEQLHHEKKHQHTSDGQCPVEKIIWDAIDSCSATHSEGEKK